MRWLLVPLLLAQTTFYCSTGPGNALPVETLILKVGQTGRGRSVLVTFEGIVSDSRCPLDVQCVQRGDALARFRTTSRAGKDVLELLLVDRRIGDLAGAYRLEFRSLTPDPLSTRPIDPASYVATVDVWQR